MAKRLEAGQAEHAGRIKVVIAAEAIGNDPSGVPDDVVVDLMLPFVPTVGMHMSPTLQSDFYEVERVYWTANNPDELQVYVKPVEPMRPVEEMLRQGWRRMLPS